MDLSKTQRLSKKVVAVWRISAAIAVALVCIAIAAGFLILVGTNVISAFFFLIPIIISLLLIIFFIIVLPAIRYRRFSYIISDDEIVIKYGIFIITHTIVPMIKVQYTDTTQGPIMRSFRLAAVKVMTAGGTVEIPGLPINDAENLRDQITALAKTVKENV